MLYKDIGTQKSFYKCHGICSCFTIRETRKLLNVLIRRCAKMELALICFSVAILVKFIKMRSAPAVVSHITFLVVIVLLSLFTTDIPFIAQFMKNAYGLEYLIIRDYMSRPCVWIYSTNFTLYVIEILVLILLQLLLVTVIVKKIRKHWAKQYFRKTRRKPAPFNVRFELFRTKRHTYLYFCRLLN